MLRPLRSKCVGVRAEVGLEDRFEYQLQCPLHHAVADTRNLKRSDFAVVFRYFDRAVLFGFVSTCEQLFPNRRQELGNPYRFDVREALAIDARRPAVLLGYPVRFLQGLHLRDVHE